MSPAILLLALLCSAVQPPAQKESVEDRLYRLEKQLAEMSRRLEALEKLLAEKGDKEKPSANPGDGWKGIRKGLSETEVESLLGKPKKVSPIGRREKWYYDDGLRTHVEFQDGKVTGWAAP